ncbi:hypothetical protein ACH5RR_029341 [Cinchona calisaya]|uniref:Uncharacterized protein n=1 Tax=Cinchona calisaya TaxID=153742 RepID=A0ABD2YUX4_9GENT
MMRFGGRWREDRKIATKGRIRVEENDEEERNVKETTETLTKIRRGRYTLEGQEDKMFEDPSLAEKNGINLILEEKKWTINLKDEHSRNTLVGNEVD